MVGLEHCAVPGPGFAPEGQKEPEAGEGVGDRVALAAGSLSGIESGGGLWRQLKGKALGNRPTLWMEELMEHACRYIQSLFRVEHLRKAGVLSENFWLTT